MFLPVLLLRLQSKGAAPQRRRRSGVTGLALMEEITDIID